MKRAFLLLLLAPCAAVSAADPAKTWQKANKAVDRAERAYWDKFKTRFSESQQEFRRPVSDARDKPDLPASKEAVYNYKDITALYTEYEEIANGRGVADQEFAGSDHPKAVAMLLAALMADAKKIDRIAADLDDAKPDYGRYTYNQESGVRLFGMRAAHANRIVSMGKAAGAVEYLTAEGWRFFRPRQEALYLIG